MLAIGLPLYWHFYKDGGFEPFTVLPLPILGFVGFLFHKKANAINHELFSNFNIEIDELENLYESYSTKSCMTRVDKILNRIEKSTLPRSLSSKLKARLYFLQGQCFTDFGDNDKGFPLLLKAASLSEDIKYQERKCTITYHSGEEQKAKKIAQSIINLDPLNPRANAIKYAPANSLEIKNVNSILKKDKTFVNILGNIFSKRDQIEILDELVDLKSISLPKVLERDEYHYWIFILACGYSKYLRENQIVYSTRHITEPNNFSDLISFVNSISEIVLNATKKTELYEQSQTLKAVEFIYLHTKYLISFDLEIPLKMAETISQEGYKVNENEFLTTITCLGQVKQNQRLILFKNHEFVERLNLEAIFALAFAEIDNVEEAISLFQKYIQNLNSVQNFALKNITTAIEYLRLQKIETGEIFDNQLGLKKYESQADRLLVEIACKKTHIPKDDLKTLILSRELEYQSLNIDNKEYICSCLNQIGEYDKSNELLMTDLDLSRDSLMSFLYLDNLYKSRTQYNKLIEGLEYWRTNHKPVFTLLHYEIEIHHTLRSYDVLEDVCKYGLEHFQSQKALLLYYLIIALNGQPSKKNELKKLLASKNTLDCNFNLQMVLHIARICMNSGLHELGFELAYKETISRPGNIQLKQHFFALAAQHLDESKIKNPIKVELDSSVVLTDGTVKHVIHISNDTISGNKIVSEILDKEPGFTFQLEDKMTGESQELTIDRVLNKYSGLMTEIMYEVSSERGALGYDIKTVTWENDDINSINQVLSSAFGDHGDKRQIIQENAFNSFNQGKISFTDLVLRVNTANSLEIYRFLTSNSTACINVVPKSLLDQTDFTKVDEYVLDITSLLTLSKLVVKIDLKGTKLLVSQILVDYLEFKIEEVENMPEEAMNLTITSQGVRPYFYPKNYKQEFLEELLGLKEWLVQNCTIEFSPEKLDLIMQDPALLERDNWHFQMCLDNMLIANKPNRSIISDDLMSFQKLQSFTNPITVEHFLRLYYSDKLTEYQIKLLELNQVGLTLDSIALTKCFEDNPIIESPNNLFRKAINNLSFHKHGDPNLIFEVILTVKNIYLLDLERGFKQRLTRSLFTEVLKGYPISANSGKTLSDFILKEFHFLGDLGTVVLTMLKEAQEVINKTHSL